MLRAVRFTDEDFDKPIMSRRPSKTLAARRLSLALRSSLTASPWAQRR
jgi:hypothetical protein